MAFSQKTWKDRITEYPTRRALIKSDGSSEIVTVSRAEGAVSQEGDAFSAANMNDLEARIAEAIGAGSDASTVKYDTETDTLKLLNESGEWVTWKEGVLGRTYLVQDGVVNTNLVGSFVASKYTEVSDGSAGDATVQTVDGALRPGTTGSGWKRGSIVSSQAINVSDYNYLCIEYSIAKNISNSTAMSKAIVAGLTGAVESGYTLLKESTILGTEGGNTSSSGVLRINISDVQGPYYPVIYRVYNSFSASVTIVMDVANIWLEK